MAEDLFDALLVHDTWDDDGYRTMFTLRVLTREGWIEVGTVKIGHVATDGENVPVNYRSRSTSAAWTARAISRWARMKAPTGLSSVLSRVVVWAHQTRHDSARR
jgi:hypothetical protein